MVRVRKFSLAQFKNYNRLFIKKERTNTCATKNCVHFFIIIKDIYYSRTFYQARSQTHFGEGQDKEMFTGRGEQSTNLGRWIGV